MFIAVYLPTKVVARLEAEVRAVNSRVVPKPKWPFSHTSIVLEKLTEPERRLFKTYEQQKAAYKATRHSGTTKTGLVRKIVLEAIEKGVLNGELLR